MNLHLDDAERAFRDEVRDFLTANLREEWRAGQCLTSGSYPPPDVAVPWQRVLHRRGWLAPLWPVAHGGTGWSGVQRFVFESESAAAGAPLLHPMGLRFVGPVIIRFGSDDQQRRFLPRILASEDYWCQGFSEPQAGSDLASLSMSARRDGDDYVLDGTKMWTTNAQFANWMFALVRTSREARLQQGISFLLVDMRSPGITVRPIATIGGDHDVNQVFFDGVRVPVHQRVGAEGQGWECARYLLEFERGAGFVAPRLRSNLARVRQAMGAAGSVPDACIARLGELSAAMDAFEWLEFRSLARLAPGSSPGPVSSVLKLRSGRLKQDIAQLGVDALGEAVLRWRTAVPGDPRAAFAQVMVPDHANSRAYTIFGGSAEVQLNLIARTLAGAGRGVDS